MRCGLALTLPSLLLGFAGCSLLTSLDGLHSGDASPVDGSADVADEPLPPPKPTCDPSAKPSTSAIFVSPTGDDTLAGTAAAPVKTLAVALSLAKAQSATDVYIDEGTYSEAVAIASPTTLHGGWKAQGANWSKDCSDTVVGATIVRSPTTQAVAAKGFTGAAGLDTLTLVTKAQGASGESGIAVLVSGAGIAFTINGVDLTAATGGDGTTPPTPPPTGNTTCNGLSSCADGAQGATGGAGTPAPTGSFGANGFTAASAGGGLGGGPGHNGTAGTAGETQTGCVNSCGAAPGCASGPATGTNSGGTGTCGCGGVGGTGGGAGTSGGASVGVYVFGATLTIDQSTVRAGHGGAGAPGANGGGGGAGTTGAAGASSFCAGSCAYDGSQCILTGTSLFGGGAGGHGGPGGVGGTGGGGAGGPSYGIVYTGGAVANIGTATAIQVGAGGKGASGAPDGASSATFKP